VAGAGVGAGIGASIVLTAGVALVAGLVPLMIISIVLAVKWDREEQAELIKQRIIECIQKLKLEQEIIIGITASLTKKKNEILDSYQLQHVSRAQQQNNN
jgi:hypothetical protein